MRSPLRLRERNSGLRKLVKRSVITPVKAEPTPTPSAPVVAGAKPTKASKAVDVVTQESLLSLPYIENSFRLISCSRKKATALQKWLYTVNKNNAAGRHYATRYNYAKAELIVWRMA